MRLSLCYRSRNSWQLRIEKGVRAIGAGKGQPEVALSGFELEREPQKRAAAALIVHPVREIVQCLWPETIGVPVGESALLQHRRREKPFGELEMSRAFAGWDRVRDTCERKCRLLIARRESAHVLDFVECDCRRRLHRHRESYNLKRASRQSPALTDLRTNATPVFQPTIA